MSDGSSEAHWSLNDEELEALMAGATPGDLARVGNPVAEFFSDARSGRAISSPRPDGLLQQIFNSGVSVVPTIPPQPTTWPSQASQAPRVEAQGPGRDPEVDEVTRPQPTVARFNPQADQPLAPATTWLTAVEVPGGNPAFEGGLLDRQTPPTHAPPRSHAGSVYRASPVELLAQVLRPTGPKLLMGVAMLALLITAGPALGLFDLPFSESSGVENQATGGADLVGTPAATGSPTSLDEAASPSFGAAGDNEVASPETSQALATPDPTVAPTVAQQTSAETSAPETSASTETTDTTASETTTSSTPEITTTLDGTATTDVSDPTTTPTSEVTSTTEPPPTTVVGAVILAPGQAYLIPDDRPAGRYQGTVPGGGVCLIRVFLGSGGETPYLANGGESIVFRLADGDTVNVSVGCPLAYSVT